MVARPGPRLSGRRTSTEANADPLASGFLRLHLNDNTEGAAEDATTATFQPQQAPHSVVELDGEKTCTEKPDLLRLLPKLAQHLIAKMVGASARPYFCSLRVCSQYWKHICDAVIPVISIDAHHLPAFLPFLRRLPCLKKLSITGYNSNTACTVKSRALSGLTADLNDIALCAAYQDASGQMYAAPAMRISDLSSLLLPYSRNLAYLRIINCHLLRCEGVLLSSPGFFAKFPCLQELQLEYVTAKPDLTSLQMAGCTQLQLLSCRNCNLTALDLTACHALTALDCSDNSLTELDISACVSIQLLSCTSNKLTALDVSACAGSVTDLHCYFNRLSTLDLSACSKLRFMHCHNNRVCALDLSASAGLKDIDVRCNSLEQIRFSDLAVLDKVICVQNPPGLILSGCAKLLNLECDAAAFTSLAPSTRFQLPRLVLGTAASGNLEGFGKLKYLGFIVDHSAPVSLDLSGCAEGSVEINSASLLQRFPFNGRSSVWKLSMTRGCWDDLHGFTNLTELHYHVDGLRALDFSECASLRKVFLTELSRPSRLTEINVAGCVLLEELCCEGFTKLARLNLSSCAGLKVLKCTGSGVRCLDVSCCPLLKSLDVSGSFWLRSLCVENCHQLGNIVSNGCTKMLVT